MYNFTNNYNRNNFIDFLENSFLPEDFQLKEEKLSLNFSPKFTSSATRLGVCKSLELEVFEIEHNSTHDARVGISSDAFQVMQKNSYCNKALVAFVPKGSNQYRFSFLQIEAEQKDHSARIERNYSNPRRYSYLLGKGIGGYTPNKFLLGKGRIKDKKDLAERFSVEVLTKAFYGELSDWYAWAIKNVQFPGEYEMETEEKRIEHRSKNIIRLLTRLLFVWFLKQKNLIPNELFDINFLSNKLVKDFDPNLKTGLFAQKSYESKYYKAILQNLFFATLNCPITPQSKEDSRTRGFRKKDWYGQGFGYDHLMRYEELFIDPQLFSDLVNAKVPFLNGGLFDCLDDKQNKTYIDGFSDDLLKPNMLIVPDFLFFGEKKGEDLSDFYGDRKKKSVDALGLIDILQKYNFTIEENTPFDQEVSLDPELLGKVFENLLASYNPETKTTARKQTGSFYTPREIVQYMVNESLIAHLKHTVGEEYEEEFRKLMQYSDEDLRLDDKIKHAIIQSIQTCKVLDPACGSGAFPVGVLQQMVHILSQLDPKNEIWKNLILEESVRELSSTLKDYTNEEREEIQTDINRSFDDNINRPDYARKLYLIEKCIYGVDIQSIAVQISKLRFFISLVVDQCPTNNSEDNFGIRPLPNLEAKFVSANTLIGLSKTKTLFDSPEVEKLQEKLNQTNHRIFGAKSNKSKNKHKARVGELQAQIAGKLEELGVVGNEDARLMQQWKMFDQNASSPFFDSEWMFGLKSGASNQDGYFDIVIGNPPYVNISNLKPDSYRENLKVLFYSAKNKSDTYAFFVEKSFDLLKYNGVTSFIIPQTWKATDSFSNLRKIIFKDHTLYKAVDLEFGVFTAIVKPMIVFLKKERSHENLVIQILNDKFERKIDIQVSEILSNPSLSINTHISAKQKKVFKKIENQSIRLENFIKFSRGIKTSDDNRFISNKEKDNYSKKVYRGKNIKAYQLNWGGEYIWYKPELMKEKVGSVSYSKDFFEIQEKLVIQRVNSSMQLLCAYDNKQNYFLDTTNVSRYNDRDKTVSMKYLCALLNSKVINFWYCNTYLMPTIGIYELHSIPVKIAIDQQPIIDLVNQILSKKEIDSYADIRSIERKIDQIIYEIYDLTEEEIGIIES